MFQGVMNSVGTFVFDSIKPFVLKEANTNIRNDMNKEVQKFPKSSLIPSLLSTSLWPRLGEKSGIKVADYNNTVGVFDVFLTNTWLYGISSFHRTRDIKFEMRNKTVHTILAVGTQRLKGTSNWDIGLMAGIMSKSGTVSFSVEYVRVRINASQSMDTSQHPNLDDIQLEVGNIQIRFDGLGTADYVVEFAINVLPNLLRYQIMDALEKPVRFKIQEALDQVNIERVIRENADKLDSGNTLDNIDFLHPPSVANRNRTVKSRVSIYRGEHVFGQENP
ncbi:hypothetical protein NQ318_008142 [Aromia moschata]|uniref:Uncharacterized protein n=1 Tax=Aromia moschata TaxID=1265417 RepID=A0AAV8YQE7_9CUCU|nr:hypothetical protein NQ318_008142 [Aromia moschata]